MKMKNTIYQNLWDIRAVLNGKFTAMSAYINKKKEIVQINNLPVHLKCK
jgi:hypothetical protein